MQTSARLSCGCWKETDRGRDGGRQRLFLERMNVPRGRLKKELLFFPGLVSIPIPPPNLSLSSLSLAPSLTLPPCVFGDVLLFFFFGLKNDSVGLLLPGLD